METAAEVLERATRRKDVIPQVWSHTLRAEALLRQSKPGTLHEAIDGYEKSLKLLEQNIDQGERHPRFGCAGAGILAERRSASRPGTWQLPPPKRLSATRQRPTPSKAMRAWREVFLSAWEKEGNKHRAAAKKACKAIAKFAGVFPLGQPRLKLFQGWFHWLDGNPEKARLHWEEALKEAERLNMPYEQARALLYLGKHVLSGEEKAGVLNRSLELLNRLEVQHEAEQVKALLS
ncbi:MAG: hypothetical protein HND47_06095 [Chloroflexi bacterium]|nr:hypothetical protein [Chloroflexota bacterium]